MMIVIKYLIAAIIGAGVGFVLAAIMSANDE